MKVTILGKGLAGVITAMYWHIYKPDAQLEIIFDASVPTQPVGSGSWPTLARMLSMLYGWKIDWANNPFNATPKLGIMYEGWGDTDQWFHPFEFSDVAMHFDPRALQEHFCASNIANIVEKRVVDYNDVDADIVFDCTGFPDDFDHYTELRNPLNRVMLADKPVEPSSPWTRAVATPHGWCFVIPLADRTQLGYLFNNNVTPDEQARSDFGERFDVDGINQTFSFRNYCANQPIIDDRVFLNGNKLFFIELMEATSVSGYTLWAKLAMQVACGEMPAEAAVTHMHSVVRENMNFILYHYQFGSRYKTPFWQYAKTLAVDDPYLSQLMATGLRRADMRYGFHQMPSVMNMYDALGPLGTPDSIFQAIKNPA
ncbi:Flavin-dependent tryptophan halogenase RebH [BD1-7 clade bacterium]|uniref:Flavin-dependent tryptophan halogenase RebH n=1 Tax=BD1-7 clade bacterium TaxID=2029982 RepID=A0A5S9PCY8_9GAMM|nr:Flavin-dependent tryptophan halogenase RebH [BD1-7 clade bacterium]CAA0102475.1 Flavin-dependent tryptophan halogenase RebH [BD1-7 clade bacterium]